MIKRVPSQQKDKKKTKKNKDKQIVIVNNIQPPQAPESDLRTINLYIVEQKASEVVSALLYLEGNSHTILPIPEEEESKKQEEVVVARSISLIISTHGGVASDMFSILDIMDMIKERTCDIETFGIGKVMSAGVPILAAGTKGRRKVGRNCRIMLHNVLAGTGGTITSMENEDF